jgi:hypothetical protein
VKIFIEENMVAPVGGRSGTYAYLHIPASLWPDRREPHNISMCPRSRTGQKQHSYTCHQPRSYPYTVRSLYQLILHIISFHKTHREFQWLKIYHLHPIFKHYQYGLKGGIPHILPLSSLLFPFKETSMVSPGFFQYRSR